jgi:5-formyltetrahydrofolate cyclo-ligase
VDSSAALDKTAVRAELTAARRGRPPEIIAAARRAIVAVILAEQVRQGWRNVAAYVPLRTEPGSPELLAGLTSVGVRVLVPILCADRDLDWMHWEPAGDVSDPLGIAAIATVDAVLVPALAVGADGTRLGRGGGSYDRALARVSAGVPIAALLYDDELRPSLPADPWDVRVNAVVTPAGWRPIRLDRRWTGMSGPRRAL